MASVLPDTASDGKALTDAWDYKGRPASRATTGGWACAAMILGNLTDLPTISRASTAAAHDDYSSTRRSFVLCTCICMCVPCVWS
jgi:hypothetical protein